MDRDMFEARIQMLQAEVQIYRDGMVDATRRINELRELAAFATMDVAAIAAMFVDPEGGVH